MPDIDPNTGAGGGTPSVGPSDPAFSRAVLDVDRVFDSLANARRRYLCYAVLSGEERTLEGLAGLLAAWEHDVPEHAVTGRQRHRMCASLRHVHVPKLVEWGVVAVEEPSGRVVRGPQASEVLRALEWVGAGLDIVYGDRTGDDDVE